MAIEQPGSISPEEADKKFQRIIDGLANNDFDGMLEEARKNKLEEAKQKPIIKKREGDTDPWATKKVKRVEDLPNAERIQQIKDSRPDLY